MLKSLITTAGAGMMALTMTAAPAAARDYHHRYYHDSRGSYYYDATTAGIAKTVKPRARWSAL
jgi:hypothetical protein